MTEPEERKVSYASMNLGELNPNHKLRLCYLGFPDSRWIANVGFVRRDESIYIAPKLHDETPFSGKTVDGKTIRGVVRPDEDLHISVHESGVVNLTVGDTCTRLRGATEELPRNQIVVFGIAEPSILAPASHAEINALSNKYELVPVPGFPQLGPVFVTVFRVLNADEWEPPTLSDMFQVNVLIPIRGKDVAYGIVVWQNERAPRIQGGIAVSI